MHTLLQTTHSVPRMSMSTRLQSTSLICSRPLRSPIWPFPTTDRYRRPPQASQFRAVGRRHQPVLGQRQDAQAPGVKSRPCPDGHSQIAHLPRLHTSKSKHSTIFPRNQPIPCFPTLSRPPRGHKHDSPDSPRAPGNSQAVPISGGGCHKHMLIGQSPRPPPGEKAERFLPRRERAETRLLGLGFRNVHSPGLCSGHVIRQAFAQDVSGKMFNFKMTLRKCPPRRQCPPSMPNFHQVFRPADLGRREATANSL